MWKSLDDPIRNSLFFNVHMLPQLPLKRTALLTDKKGVIDFFLWPKRKKRFLTGRLFVSHIRSTGSCLGRGGIRAGGRRRSRPPPGPPRTRGRAPCPGSPSTGSAGGPGSWRETPWPWPWSWRWRRRPRPSRARWRRRRPCTAAGCWRRAAWSPPGKKQVKGFV